MEALKHSRGLDTRRAHLSDDGVLLPVAPAPPFPSIPTTTFLSPSLSCAPVLPPTASSPTTRTRRNVGRCPFRVPWAFPLCISSTRAWAWAWDASLILPRHRFLFLMGGRVLWACDVTESSLGGLGCSSSPQALRNCVARDGLTHWDDASSL